MNDHYIFVNVTHRLVRRYNWPSRPLGNQGYKHRCTIQPYLHILLGFQRSHGDHFRIRQYL